MLKAKVYVPDYGRNSEHLSPAVFQRGFATGGCDLFAGQILSMLATLSCAQWFVRDLEIRVNTICSREKSKSPIKEIGGNLFRCFEPTSISLPTKPELFDVQKKFLKEALVVAEAHQASFRLSTEPADTFCLHRYS